MREKIVKAMSQKHPRILDPTRVGLIVVDIQERFESVISGFEDMAAAGSEDAVIRFLEDTARDLSLG